MEPRQGDLRVWNVLSTPNSIDFRSFPVADPQEAARLIDKLAAEQLCDPDVVYNAFGMEVFDVFDGWLEWYDDSTGVDILEYANDMRNA